MNWIQIIVTLITACVPALISYLVAVHKSKSEIQKLKAQAIQELRLLEKDYELKLKEIQINNQAQLDTLEKEYQLQANNSEQEKIGKLAYNMLKDKSLSEVAELGKQADKLNSKNFISKNISNSKGNFKRSKKKK